MTIIGLKVTGDHGRRYFRGLLLWDALSTPLVPLPITPSVAGLPRLLLPNFLPCPRHNSSHPPFAELPGVCTCSVLQEIAHSIFKPLVALVLLGL